MYPSADLASKYNKEEAKRLVWLADNYRYFVYYDLEIFTSPQQGGELSRTIGILLSCSIQFEPVVNIKIVMGFHRRFWATCRFANDWIQKVLMKRRRQCSFLYYANKNKARTYPDVQPLAILPSLSQAGIWPIGFAFKLPLDECPSFSQFEPSDSFLLQKGIFSTRGRSPFATNQARNSKFEKDIQERAKCVVRENHLMHNVPPLLAIGESPPMTFDKHYINWSYPSIQDIAGNRAQQVSSSWSVLSDRWSSFLICGCTKHFSSQYFADYENQEELAALPFWRWKMSRCPHRQEVEVQPIAVGTRHLHQETRRIIIDLLLSSKMSRIALFLAGRDWLCGDRLCDRTSTRQRTEKQDELLITFTSPIPQFFLEIGQLDSFLFMKPMRNCLTLLSNFLVMIRVQKGWIDRFCHMIFVV